VIWHCLSATGLAPNRARGSSCCVRSGTLSFGRMHRLFHRSNSTLLRRSNRHAQPRHCPCSRHALRFSRGNADTTLWPRRPRRPPERNEDHGFHNCTSPASLAAAPRTRQATASLGRKSCGRNSSQSQTSFEIMLARGAQSGIILKMDVPSTYTLRVFRAKVNQRQMASMPKRGARRAAKSSFPCSAWKREFPDFAVLLNGVAGDLQSSGSGPFFGSHAPQWPRRVGRKHGPDPFALRLCSSPERGGGLMAFGLLSCYSTDHARTYAT
jgi:hypothetical protein